MDEVHQEVKNVNNRGTKSENEEEAGAKWSKLINRSMTSPTYIINFTDV